MMVFFQWFFVVVTMLIGILALGLAFSVSRSRHGEVAALILGFAGNMFLGMGGIFLASMIH